MSQEGWRNLTPGNIEVRTMGESRSGDWHCSWRTTLPRGHTYQPQVRQRGTKYVNEILYSSHDGSNHKPGKNQKLLRKGNYLVIEEFLPLKPDQSSDDVGVKDLDVDRESCIDNSLLILFLSALAKHSTVFQPVIQIILFIFLKKSPRIFTWITFLDWGKLNI